MKILGFSISIDDFPLEVAWVSEALKHPLTEAFHYAKNVFNILYTWWNNNILG